MSESASDSTGATPAATPAQTAAFPAMPKLDPVAVFFTLGSEVRLPIMRMLAAGQALSVGEIAAALGRDLDGVGKQMFVLRDAGLVTATAGRDRRQTIYQIPASLRPAPGALELGFARLELARL
jgi:DNA-binding transcriptional ArsR family regulator